MPHRSLELGNDRAKVMMRYMRGHGSAKRVMKLSSVTRRAAWVVVGAYAVATASCAVAQRSLIYHPDATVPAPERYGVPEMDAVRFAAGEGVNLLGWWKAPRHESSPVIVFFHGNAGHLGYRAGKARMFMDAGYGVLLVSWRYNAGAGGDASEEGLIADGRAALDYLAHRGIAPGRVVVYGESLGGGVAVALAAEEELAGVVLEAPFSSLAEVAQHHFWYLPARWLVVDEFDSIDRISHVSEPLLVVHGDDDRVIPRRFAESLYSAAPGPKEAQFLPGAGHNDLYAHGAGEIVVGFIDRRIDGSRLTERQP